MSINVLFHDTRIRGGTPRPGGTKIYTVDQHTPLQYFIDTCLVEIGWHGGIDTLTIIGHGASESGQLGFGIHFCNEGLNHNTVFQLLPLQDKIQKIILPACGAARISPPNQSYVGTWRGDGHQLCRRIALTVKAILITSTERQVYRRVHGVINFGQWEGLVLTYGRDGAIIDRERHPSGWRDSDGHWQGNR